MIFLGTVAMIVVGGLFLQYNYFAFLERQRKHIDEELEASKVESLRAELTEYKKKVDALVMRAGFKL
jgi:hypothetical protein